MIQVIYKQGVVRVVGHAGASSMGQRVCHGVSTLTHLLLLVSGGRGDIKGGEAWVNVSGADSVAVDTVIEGYQMLSRYAPGVVMVVSE